MDYDTVKDWLDNVVCSIKDQRSLSVLTESIKLSQSPDLYVTMVKGIDIVADIMGLRLHHFKNSGDGTHQYSFSYQNVKFIQLSLDPLEGKSDEI